MRTVGTDELVGPRNVVQWSTSRSAARRDRPCGYQSASRTTLDTRPGRRTRSARARARAGRGARPRARARAAPCRRGSARAARCRPRPSARLLQAARDRGDRLARLGILEQRLGVALGEPAVVDVLLVQGRLPAGGRLGRERMDPDAEPAARRGGSRARAGTRRSATGRRARSPRRARAAQRRPAPRPSSIPPATRCQ